MALSSIGLSNANREAEIVRGSAKQAVALAVPLYLEQQLIHPEIRKVVRLVLATTQQSELDDVLYDLSSYTLDPSEADMIRRWAATAVYV